MGAIFHLVAQVVSLEISGCFFTVLFREYLMTLCACVCVKTRRKMEEEEREGGRDVEIDAPSSNRT